MKVFSDIITPVQPPTQTLAGCIEVYDNILLNSQAFILIAEAINRWRDALVSNYIDDNDLDKNYRSNLILDINYDEYSTHPLFTYMNDLVRNYLDDYCARYDIDYEYIEPTQLLKYYPGEFYKKHFDTGPPFPRVISGLLYLNDVEDGGETYFTNFDIAIRPKAGRLVLFPSNYAYMHEARPPVHDNKYVFVFWTRECGRE